MEELKACPFCGEEARVSYSVNDSMGIGCSYIDCIIFLPDDVEGTKLAQYVWIYSDHDEAIQAWNTRVENSHD